MDINKLENFEVIQLSEIKIEFLENASGTEENSKIEQYSQTNKDIKPTSENVSNFIDNWLKAITNRKSDDAQNKEIKSCILRDLKANEELRNLASKPLMLSLICMQYSKHKQNNSSKKKLTEWHIVHRAIRVWLEESNERYWKKQKQINGNDTSISINFVYELLEFIAYKTIDIRVLNISRIKLSQHINSFVKDYYGWDDKQKINSFTYEILRFLENTYGFTLLKDDNMYSFPHVIFRNYFAIRYIYNKYENIAAFEKDVAGKVQWVKIIERANIFPTELIFGLPDDDNNS